MKILYITTVSRTINAFLIPHIKMLINNGNEVDVACNIDLPISDELKECLVKVNRIDFSRNPLSISNINAYKQIKKLIEINKYDMIHVHTPIASFITRMASRNIDLKKVYTAHGFHFYNGSSIINWGIYYPLEKIAAKWTDAIITINNEDYLLAKQKFNHENSKIYKINGIGVDLSKYSNKANDLNSFKEVLGLKEDDFIITVIAELIKRKNHKQIIDTIKVLKDKYPNIKLLLVGDGELSEQLREYINKNGLENNISMLGFRKDVDEIISISDVVGLFSFQEGLPRNLMEAMSIGKPIICTNIRGNNDLVKNDVNGILVNINDIKGTKEAVLKLYNNRELSNKFSENGKKEVKKYDIENVLKSMNDIYSEVITS